MSSTLFKFFSDRIGYIISPPFCESCKEFIKERSIFCDSCFQKIKPIVSIKLQVTEKYSMQVFSISDYSEPLKSLILAKMSSNILPSKFIGKLIWNMTNVSNMEFDYLVPIPLHWSRYIKRGFNQSEVIALEISRMSKKPVIDILKRVKITKYQSSLNIQKRVENVKSAFAISIDDKSLYLGKNLLIVDDLFTSGSTLISAAGELSKLNPASINAIVACRVVK